MGDLLTEDTSYPVSIDTHTRAADLLDTVVAQHINGPGTAIVALETECGVGLRGIMVDLASRLAVNTGADGGLVQSATVPLSPPHVPHWYYNSVSNTVFVYNISTASYDAVSTATVLASYIRKDLATTIIVAHTFNPGVAGPPFTLGANATGQLVTGLNADQLQGKTPGAASGVATLDASSKVIQRLAYEGAASGVATLDASSKLASRLAYEAAASGVPTLNASTQVVQRLAYEGVNSGVATLNSSGKVVQNPATSYISTTPAALSAYNAHSMAPGALWTPPAGIYIMTTLVGSSLKVGIWDGFAFVTNADYFGGGTIITDGTNVRLVNTGGGGLDVAYRTL